MSNTVKKAAPDQGKAASVNTQQPNHTAPAAERKVEPPFVAAAEEIKPNVVLCKGASPTADLTKLELAAKALGWGRNRLIARLKKDKVLQRDRMPYQYYVDHGLLKVVEREPWKDSYGNRYRCFTTLVTSKGQAWLMDRYGPAANGISHESEV